MQQPQRSRKMQLPKQWRHWLSRVGLRPAYTDRMSKGKCRYVYLKGRGHVWRIAYHYDGDLRGQYTFQRGDIHASFDRWALCKIYELQHVPTTFAELREFVGTAVDFAAIQSEQYVSVENINVSV